MQTNRNSWLRVGFSMWSLGIEASSVIALRMVKFASGGSGVGAEARRMITEKVEAGLDVQRLAMTGALNASPSGAMAKTLSNYRRRVRANKRRLTKD